MQIHIERKIGKLLVQLRIFCCSSESRTNTGARACPRYRSSTSRSISYVRFPEGNRLLDRSRKSTVLGKPATSSRRNSRCRIDEIVEPPMELLKNLSATPSCFLLVLWSADIAALLLGGRNSETPTSHRRRSKGTMNPVSTSSIST